MKSLNPRYTTVFAAVLLSLCGAARADLQAQLMPLPAFQVGTEGVISFGTIVTAHTNLNALWASANYRIECSDPAIRPALTGGRGWSDNGFTGPRRVFITAPEYLPAQQALPGWINVMGGTYVSCVNTQWGAAKTHILPIGSGGTAFPIGGDYWEKTESVTFGVIKPGTANGGGICIM
jgi:hypothetical protein